MAGPAWLFWSEPPATRSGRASRRWRCSRSSGHGQGGFRGEWKRWSPRPWRLLLMSTVGASVTAVAIAGPGVTVVSAPPMMTVGAIVSAVATDAARGTVTRLAGASVVAAARAGPVAISAVGWRWRRRLWPGWLRRWRERRGPPRRPWLWLRRRQRLRRRLRPLRRTPAGSTGARGGQQLAGVPPHAAARRCGG